MNAKEAFDKLNNLEFNSVLDLGSGEGIAAYEFKKAGKEVTTISLVPPADYVMDFMKTPISWHEKFDCIWASHVLEHQLNVNNFLTRCFFSLKDNGIIAVTVPPLKQQIVGGHVTLWNAGLLLYNLILAGFDCSEAMVKSYGYNISVIVRKKKALLPNDLIAGCGDIEKLAKFFPMDVKQGFSGDIKRINW